PAHDGDGGAGPSPDGLPTPMLQIAASDQFTCVVTTAHEAWCEGDNGANEIDPVADAGPLAPTKAAIPASPVAELALRSQTTCARIADGHVWCSGYGPSPVQFAQVTFTDGGALVADQLASGQDFSCARLPSSEVACWGANDFGQLGRGAGPSREIAS